MHECWLGHCPLVSSSHLQVRLLSSREGLEDSGWVRLVLVNVNGRTVIVFAGAAKTKLAKVRKNCLQWKNGESGNEWPYQLVNPSGRISFAATENVLAPLIKELRCCLRDVSPRAFPHPRALHVLCSTHLEIWNEIHSPQSRTSEPHLTPWGVSPPPPPSWLKSYGRDAADTAKWSLNRAAPDRGFFSACLPPVKLPLSLWCARAAVPPNGLRYSICSNWPLQHEQASRLGIGCVSDKSKILLTQARNPVRGWFYLNYCLSLWTEHKASRMTCLPAEVSRTA